MQWILMLETLVLSPKWGRKNGALLDVHKGQIRKNYYLYNKHFITKTLHILLTELLLMYISSLAYN